MKKFAQAFIVIVALVILAVLTVWLTPRTASADLFGNNIGPLFDTYSYKAAVIKLTASQSILVEVRSWRDYDDSDTITLTDTNGMNYYTSSDNVILLSEMPSHGSVIYQALCQ